jgi:hypothetical protein
MNSLSFHIIFKNILYFKIISKEAKAINIAQNYMGKNQPGNGIEKHADKFDGYYTIHTVSSNGKISGMLSVNGYNGRVWYHN